MSKHDANFIMRQMPYARGLAFQTVYWKERGYRFKEDNGKASLDMIIE